MQCLVDIGSLPENSAGALLKCSTFVRKLYMPRRKQAAFLGSMKSSRLAGDGPSQCGILRKTDRQLLKFGPVTVHFLAVFSHF